MTTVTPTQRAEWDLNPKIQAVWINGAWVRLAPKEFAILFVLKRRIGVVVTQEVIGQLVWEDSDVVIATNLKVQLTNLRRKIRDAGGDPEQIETVRGEGLRFLD